jgi:hypothetical protein
MRHRPLKPRRASSTAFSCADWRAQWFCCTLPLRYRRGVGRLDWSHQARPVLERHSSPASHARASASANARETDSVGRDVGAGPGGLHLHPCAVAATAVAVAAGRPRRRLHSGRGRGDRAAGYSTSSEQLSAALPELEPLRGGTTVFRTAHLHALVELLDHAEEPPGSALVGGSGGGETLTAQADGVTAKPAPGVSGRVAEPPDEGCEGGDAATAAAAPASRHTAEAETAMAEQVLWMIAAAPGTVEDRANVLQLVSRELSCGGSALAGQLVKAIARAEAAIIVRNGPHVPAQALSVTPAILEDWVAWVAEDTSAGALDEGADEGDVLLHVMGAATDVRDIRLASQLADRLPDELPLTPAACKALLDLAAQRGGATGSRFVSRVWANEGAVRSLDPEAYTMLLRAELASAGSERGSSLAAAAAAAVEHRERAPLQVARQIVEAVQASGSSQPDATFGIVLTQALAERGEFTIKCALPVSSAVNALNSLASLLVTLWLLMCGHIVTWLPWPTAGLGLL